MRPPRKTNRPASIFLTALGLLFVLALTTGVIQGTVTDVGDPRIIRPAVKFVF